MQLATITPLMLRNSKQKQAQKQAQALQVVPHQQSLFYCTAWDLLPEMVSKVSYHMVRIGYSATYYTLYIIPVTYCVVYVGIIHATFAW